MKFAALLFYCDSLYEKDAFKIPESTVRNIYISLFRNDVKILRIIVRILITFSENVA